MLKRFAVLLALTAPVLADGRAQIQQAYLRSHRAMALKFVDGVFSIYSSGYRCIDPDGIALDPNVQRSRLEQLLASALRVEEDSKILSFRETGPKAHCQVRYRTRFHRYDPGTQQPIVLQIDTVCEDDWVKIGPDWLLDRTQVSLQESRRHPKP